MKFAMITAQIVFVFAIAINGQDDPTIAVSTNLVNVNVGIVDENGKSVKGLKKEMFEVYDNAEKQKIVHFSSDSAPISFGIIYDMHPTTSRRTTAVLESLRQFTKGLRDKDSFFTLVFNKRGSLILDFVPTADQVETHLRGKYSEPNALYDAIYKGAGKLRKQRNLKRVLIVITDSADHNSEHRFNDVLDQFKTLDAQVYTVLWDEAEDLNYGEINEGMGRKRIASDASGLDRAALDELAVRTGGGVRSPTVQRARELYEIYNEISREIRGQYAIGFYPKTVDGKMHNLRIKLRSAKISKKVVLTYRQAYKSIRIEE